MDLTFKQISKLKLKQAKYSNLTQYDGAFGIMKFDEFLDYFINLNKINNKNIGVFLDQTKGGSKVLKSIFEKKHGGSIENFLRSLT
jgi:hypothetical protein